MMANTEEFRGKGLSARYFMAIMGSVGLAIIYGFKVNLSITIVTMVNHTALNLTTFNHSALNFTQLNHTSLDPKLLQLQNATFNQLHNASYEVKRHNLTDGPFLWDKTIQGTILGSYFIGYIVSLMPGGMIAEYVSAKWVLAFSVLLNIIASLLMPTAAEIHYMAFIAMRVVQGIGGGISFPAVHVMVSKWAPPKERSVLASVAYSGTAIGTVVFLLASGKIAELFGWQWVFYSEGLVCIIWFLAWSILIKDTPEQQTFMITNEERDYIMSSQGTTKDSKHKTKLSDVPWLQILKSPPFWAILVAHFCNNFGWYMLLLELPTYMSEQLHFDIKDNTILSALPYFCMWIFTIILGKLLVRMQEKNWISITVSRKIGTLFSSAVPMFCLLGVSYTERTMTVVLMTIAITCIGGMYCGFLANHIDLAPNYAGTLVAITNTVATIPGITVPMIVAKLTEKSKGREDWKMIFFMTVTLYVLEMLIYTMFGTGEEQPWNKVKSSQDSERTEQTVPLKEARH